MRRRAAASPEQRPAGTDLPGWLSVEMMKEVAKTGKSLEQLIKEFVAGKPPQFGDSARGLR